jgi:hypothetical protein
MANIPGKHYLGFNPLIEEISKRNKDKVIHADLKETEFDDIVLGAVAPDSEKLRDSIKHNSEKLIECTEYEITQMAEPSQIDQLLRVSFWDEVNTAIAEQRPISERNIFKGVCSNTYWINVRDNLEWRMAYVLCPIMSYTKANKLGLHLGQKAMLDILNASPYMGSGDGKVLNVKIAQLQLRAFENLQDRTYGKAVQRIQSHNTNENHTSKDTESVEDLQKEIELLEGKKKIIPIEVDQDSPITIDVEVKDGE